MSGELWKLLDWFKNNKGKSTTKLAINSNLGAEVDLDKLLVSVEGQTVDIYTSQESVAGQAEYIRDGLDYTAWINNVEKLLKSKNIRAVHFMATINALCLDSLDALLDQLVEWKKVYSRERMSFTLNILRFPSFQSPLVLPDHLKLYYRNKLVDWMSKHQHEAYMHEHELNHLTRLIEYLELVDTPHSETFEMPKLHNDFKKFYQQYDQRRNKDFVAMFPNLEKWYNTL
jgi:hypothetical protein